jgi:hypothetical protein
MKTQEQISQRVKRLIDAQRGTDDEVKRLIIALDYKNAVQYMDELMSDEEQQLWKEEQLTTDDILIKHIEDSTKRTKTLTDKFLLMANPTNPLVGMMMNKAIETYFSILLAYGWLLNEEFYMGILKRYHDVEPIENVYSYVDTYLADF